MNVLGELIVLVFGLIYVVYKIDQKKAAKYEEWKVEQGFDETAIGL